MRTLHLGLAALALTSIIGCQNASPQQTQTQTTGAPAGNANASGNGAGDHSGSANPQGQQAATNGNATPGAAMATSKDPPTGSPMHDNSARTQKFDGGP